MRARVPLGLPFIKVAYLRKDRNELPRAKLKTLGEMDSPKLLVSLLM